MTAPHCTSMTRKTRSLYCASVSLKGDRETVRIAVAQCGVAFDFASPCLRAGMAACVWRPGGVRGGEGSRGAVAKTVTRPHTHTPTIAVYNGLGLEVQEHVFASHTGIFTCSGSTHPWTRCQRCSPAMVYAATLLDFGLSATDWYLSS